MKQLKRAAVASIVAAATFTLSLTSHAAPQGPALKVVIHEDVGGDGESLPSVTRYDPLKKVLEKGTSRLIELAYTRDRTRLLDMMQGNQADVFITAAADISAKALETLKYQFIATARPDARADFIGKGAAIENLKVLKGKSVSLPKTDTYFGAVCAAELRDFIGTDYVNHPSREYSAVVWAVENGVDSVGCIPSVARAGSTLKAKGIQVLYEGRPIPTMPVVGAPNLSSADRAAVAKVLSNLEETDVALKSLGVIGFTEGGELRLRALNGWLKQK
jgi:ABC-type phosphate/phosphonate transport system substrate-binding protein